MTFRRRPVLLLAGMVSLNVLGVNMVVPSIPEFADEFGVRLASASVLVTAFAGARMAFRLAGGVLSDRRGSMLVCLFGGLVQAGGSLLAAVAPQFWILLLARVVQGAGSSLFGTSINRYLLVISPAEQRGRSIAWFQAGILVGNTLGPLLGGFLAEIAGLRAPFWVQAGVALFIAALSVFVITERGGAAALSSTRAGAAKLLRIPMFQGVMVMAFGLFFMRAGAWNVLVPAYADDTVGLGPARIGVVVSAGALVSLVVMAAAGRVADHVGRRPVAASGLLFGGLAVVLYGTVDTYGGLVAISALTGVGVGAAAVALPTIVGDVAPLGTEGLASGLYRIANDLGWVLGPTVLAVMADQGNYTAGFLTAALPMMLGALLFVRLPETLPAPRS